MKNEKLSSIFKNKKLTAALAAALLILIASVIIIIAVSVEQSRHPLDGSFAADVGENLSAASVYTFEGEKATNVYYDGERDVTVEYTYEIREKGGEKTIELTRVENNDKKTYSFSTVTDEDGEIIAIIINTVWYYKNP